MRLFKFKRLYNFQPKFSYDYFDFYFRHRLTVPHFRSTELFSLVKKLTSLAYPTNKEIREKIWEDFYFPFRRSGEVIVVPFTVIYYNKVFALITQPSASIQVSCGEDKIEEFYLDLMKKAIRFSKILKKYPQIIEKCLPNDIKKGRILGKFVLSKLLPKKQKEKILKAYENYFKKIEPIYPISLEDYLNVAAICYGAAFGKKTMEMTPEEMYRKWADGRDCGMLEIKNRKSKRAFSFWQEHKSYCGGHPFEIVFSWHEHGIHLYPPSKERPYFKLRVTDYWYAWDFIKMTKALMKHKVPFEAFDIENVLSYLSGETYFSVNHYDKHSIFYTQENKEILKHIEWEEPKMVRWK